MKSSISILHPLFIYCPFGQMDMEKARLSATTWPSVLLSDK